MEPNTEPRTIRDWSPDDRPREKMLQKGSAALSDTELIALLLGSGTKALSAIDVARTIYQQAGNNLAQLSRMQPADFMRIRGVGSARAVVLSAAMELGRRQAVSEREPGRSIQNPGDIFDCIRPRLAHLNHEEFWMMTFNSGIRLEHSVRISAGTQKATLVDVRMIIRKALELQAVGIAIAHNHPSGTLKPSEADVRITKQVVQACAFMDIQFVDHLIVTDSGYFSFNQEGLL